MGPRSGERGETGVKGVHWHKQHRFNGAALG